MKVWSIMARNKNRQQNQNRDNNEQIQDPNQEQHEQLASGETTEGAESLDQGDGTTQEVVEEGAASDASTGKVSDPPLSGESVSDPAE